jgi:hypothetical protein
VSAPATYRRRLPQAIYEEGVFQREVNGLGAYPLPPREWSEPDGPRLGCRMLTSKQAAAALGVGRHAAGDYAGRGLLPGSVRVPSPYGGMPHWRIPADAVAGVAALRVAAGKRWIQLLAHPGDGLGICPEKIAAPGVRLLARQIVELRALETRAGDAGAEALAAVRSRLMRSRMTGGAE